MIAIVGQLACGSDGATAPTPPATALAPPAFVRHEVIPGFASGSADLFWTAVPGADGYVIETGAAPGAIDGRRLDVSSTDIRLTELPHKGVTYVRVRSRRGVDVSSASGEVAIRTFDLRDAIDAVFFRTGPLVPRDRTPCRTGGPTNCQTLIWRQMGSPTVSLLLSADLDPTARSGLRAEVTRTGTCPGSVPDDHSGRK